MDYSTRKGKIGNYNGGTVYMYDTKHYRNNKDALWDKITVLKDKMQTDGTMPMIYKGDLIGWMSKTGGVKDVYPRVPWQMTEVRKTTAEPKTEVAAADTTLPPIEVPTGFFDKYSVVVDTFFKEWKDAIN